MSGLGSAFGDVATVLASALGMATLSVAAFGLNARKKTLAGISGLVRAHRERGDGNALDRIAEELQRETERGVVQWRRADEICLLAGYVLLLNSGVGRIFI